MAQVVLTPPTVNVSAALSQSTITVTPVIKDSAGTAIDWTSWDTVGGLMTPLSPGAFQFQEDLTTVAQIVPNSDGTIRLNIAVANLIPGTCRYALYGRKTSSDSNQQICQGTFAVANI